MHIFHLEKKNQEIMAALQYKPQPQWKMGKKIQAAAYNGAGTVFNFHNIWEWIKILPKCNCVKVRL